MANVNLYNTQQTQQIENKRSSALGSLMFSVAVVILALGSYGGMKVWGMQVDKKITEVDSQVTALTAELTTTSEQFNEAHDTFLRLKYVGDNPASPILSSFSGIEKSILQGVVLSSYAYTQGSGVTLEGDAVSADAILQQLEKFRSSGVFSSVALDSVGFSEDGFVLFTMHMDFAPVQ